MKKAQPLAPIKAEKLSQQEQMKLQLQDDKDYVNLAIRHNNLIDHVVKFCQ